MKAYTDNPVVYTNLLDRTVNNVLSHKLILNFTPVDPGHLITKNHVDANLPSVQDVSTLVDIYGNNAMTSTLTLNGNPSTANHASNLSYLTTEIADAASGFTLDTVVVDAATAASPYFVKTGDVIVHPNSSPPSAGYLRCNGAVILQATYPALYSIVGTKFNFYYPKDGGMPWEQQYETNTADLITGPYAWNTAWTTDSNVLPVALTAATVVVTKSKVYILGGYVDSITCLDTVYMASIDGAGVIGAFASTGITLKLPVKLYEATAVMTANRVYLIGGATQGNVYSNKIYSAPIDVNGVIGVWSSGIFSTWTLPFAGTGIKAVILKNKLYILGGYAYPNIFNSVYMATIDTFTGAISPFVAVQSLPNTTAYGSLVVTPTRLYLIGGLSNSGGGDGVLWTSVNSYGTLGTWTASVSPNKLPTTVAFASVIVTSTHVSLVGPINGAGNGKVFYAPITADVMGTWVTGPATPINRTMPMVVATSSRIYFLGGWALAGGNSTQILYKSVVGATNNYLPRLSFTDVNTGTHFTLPDLTYIPNSGMVNLITPGTYSYIAI